MPRIYYVFLLPERYLQTISYSPSLLCSTFSLWVSSCTAFSLFCSFSQHNFCLLYILSCQSVSKNRPSCSYVWKAVVVCVCSSLLVRNQILPVTHLFSHFEVQNWLGVDFFSKMLKQALTVPFVRATQTSTCYPKEGLSSTLKNGRYSMTKEIIIHSY